MLLQEMELHEAAFYGLTKKVQILLQQNAPLNCVNKVCFMGGRHNNSWKGDDYQLRITKGAQTACVYNIVKHID